MTYDDEGVAVDTLTKVVVNMHIWTYGDKRKTIVMVCATTEDAGRRVRRTYAWCIPYRTVHGVQCGVQSIRNGSAYRERTAGHVEAGCDTVRKDERDMLYFVTMRRRRTHARPKMRKKFDSGLPARAAARTDR